MKRLLDEMLCDNRDVLSRVLVFYTIHWHVSCHIKCICFLTLLLIGTCFHKATRVTNMA